jgi:hypothetical protein
VLREALGTDRVALEMAAVHDQRVQEHVEVVPDSM